MNFGKGARVTYDSLFTYKMYIFNIMFTKYIKDLYAVCCPNLTNVKNSSNRELDAYLRKVVESNQSDFLVEI